VIWQSACACRRSLRWDQLFLVASSAFVVFGPLGKGGAGVGPSPPLVVHDGRESCCEATIKAINAKSLQRYMQSIKAALELAKPWATYHAQEAARQRALGVGDFCMAMADDGGDGGGGGGGGRRRRRRRRRRGCTSGDDVELGRAAFAFPHEKPHGPRGQQTRVLSR